MEHYRVHRSVKYEGDVSGASEWRRIKLKISCDVSAALNQRAEQPYSINACRNFFV